MAEYQHPRARNGWAVVVNPVTDDHQVVAVYDPYITPIEGIPPGTIMIGPMHRTQAEANAEASALRKDRRTYGYDASLDADDPTR